MGSCQCTALGVHLTGLAPAFESGSANLGPNGARVLSGCLSQPRLETAASTSRFWDTFVMTGPGWATGQLLAPQGAYHTGLQPMGHRIFDAAVLEAQFCLGGKPAPHVGGTGALLRVGQANVSTTFSLRCTVHYTTWQPTGR